MALALDRPLGNRGVGRAHVRHAAAILRSSPAYRRHARCPEVLDELGSLDPDAVCSVVTTRDARHVARRRRTAVGERPRWKCGVSSGMPRGRSRRGRSPDGFDVAVVASAGSGHGGVRRVVQRIAESFPRAAPRTSTNRRRWRSVMTPRDRHRVDVNGRASIEVTALAPRGAGVAARSRRTCGGSLRRLPRVQRLGAYPRNKIRLPLRNRGPRAVAHRRKIVSLSRAERAGISRGGGVSLPLPRPVSRREEHSGNGTTSPPAPPADVPQR